MERADGSYETDRLVVRRFTTDDGAAVLALAKDKESSPGALYDHPWPTSEEGARDMARWFAERDTFFAACLKDGGRIVGLVCLNGVAEKGRAELGHMFHTAFRGKGCDTEAIRCMVEQAFAEPEVRLVEARNAVDWPGQLAPLVELGFEETSRGPASFVKDEAGKPIEFTACRMELTREAWQRRGRAGEMERK